MVSAREGLWQRDDGGPDAFVHISQLERAGLDTLRGGERLTFEIEPDRKDPASRHRAVNIALELDRTGSAL